MTLSILVKNLLLLFKSDFNSYVQVTSDFVFVLFVVVVLFLFSCEASLLPLEIVT